MKRCLSPVTGLILALFIIAEAAESAVPDFANYRGRLVDASGAPLTGSFDIVFKLYGQSLGGVAFWTENHTAVIVNDGLFTVSLGTMTSFFAVEPTGDEFWLGITVGTDPEISPRTQVVSTFFSFLAGSADFADTARFAQNVADFSITQNKLSFGSVTSEKLAANSVQSSSIAPNSVENTHLQDASIDGFKIIDGSVSTIDLQDGSVTGQKIADGTIGANDLATGSVNSAAIADKSILFKDISQNGASINFIMKFNGTDWFPRPDENNTYSAGSGLSLSSGTFSVPDGGVTGAHLQDSTIGGVDISADAISTAHIQAGAITTSEIADNSIIGADIQDGGITGTDIATGSISGANIQDEGITGADIAAGSIPVGDLNFTPGDITSVITTGPLTGGKDSGAVFLGLSQTIDQPETFTNTVRLKETTFFGDSTMEVARSGIRIGTRISTFPPPSRSLIFLTRHYNEIVGITGVDIQSFYNEGAGDVFGFRSIVGRHNIQGPGDKYGIRAMAGKSGFSVASGASYGIHASAFNGFTSSNRYGVYAAAGDTTNGDGISFGIYAVGYESPKSTSIATAYGVYGVVGLHSRFDAGNYAGYFLGNAHVTGTLSKGAGSFKIDHPLDPSNKYLQHSFVESPDMMNVYNGNIITDVNGDATVTLPVYFESLNSDFRYQLTVIGVFAQAIISQKIFSNQFSIKTDKPEVEVSWQVTGIRQDAYANAHRIEVVLDKPAKEKGLYLHPVEHGLSETIQLHYAQNKEAQEPPQDIRDQ